MSIGLMPCLMGHQRNKHKFTGRGAQIEQERRAGALIVADNKSGYWVTDDPAEAQRFARSMKHRAKEILRTARAIERGAGLD